VGFRGTLFLELLRGNQGSEKKGVLWSDAEDEGKGETINRFTIRRAE